MDVTRERGDDVGATPSVQDALRRAEEAGESLAVFAIADSAGSDVG
jgi:hypothetical protein